MPDIVEYVEWGDDEKPYYFPIPAGWKVEIRNLGVEVWVHSPDGEMGVSETASNRAQALRQIKKRLEGWLGVIEKHPYDGLRNW